MTLKTLFIIFFTFILYGKEITSYKVLMNKCIKFNNKEYVVIRKIEFNNSQSKYLIVNPNNLLTNIIDSKHKYYECNANINNTRYKKLLLLSISNKNHPLQNDGITKATKGIYLTTDLCPSSKKYFEERLYKAIINKYPNPVPVTIFITKKWIEKHTLAFNKLRQWEKEKKLNIIWGNHTAMHIYHPKLPLKENFVLSKEENLIQDILLLELALIKNNITPSIFFRFPGLVSNKKAIKTVFNLGLVTIGANTWLVKGEKIKNGSIILVHGNKNEPKGVDILLNYLKKNIPNKLNSLNQLNEEE